MAARGADAAAVGSTIPFRESGSDCGRRWAGGGRRDKSSPLPSPSDTTFRGVPFVLAPRGRRVFTPSPCT